VLPWREYENELQVEGDPTTRQIKSITIYSEIKLPHIPFSVVKDLVEFLVFLAVELCIRQILAS
jgi:hypothetical protein